MLGGCSGGSSGSGGHGPKVLDHLSIGLASAVSTSSPIVIALEQGIYRQDGLDVTLNIGTNNIASVLASGGVDLALLPINTVTNMTNQGQSTSVVWGINSATVSAALVSSSSITSVAQLQAKNPCTIASTTPGSGFSYAYAAYYKKSLGLANCKIVSYGSTSIVAGVLAAGRADAAAGTLDPYFSAIQAHKVNILIDNRSAADMSKYNSDNTGWTGAVIAGETANLKAKKAAVVSFIKAMNDTIKFMQTASAAQVAKLLVKAPGYNAIPEATLSQQYTDDRVFLNPANGWISETNWSSGLNALSGWGIPGYDPSNPNYAYDKRVDMSYYVTALGRPSSSG
jgi:hypothetical protein